MRNPLIKRLPREFVGELGKYMVIFLLMTCTIGLVSGFLVADESMMKAYDESFEKYHIENGHFELMAEAAEEQIKAIEEEQVTLYENFYIDKASGDNTLRVFPERKEVNLVCLMKGQLPVSSDEIAIDRMYADNNGLKVGDVIPVGKEEMTISGLVALSDYSTMFSDNSDMMFDAIQFGVAVVTENAFADFGTGGLHYSYAWVYEEAPETEAEEQEVSEDLMKQIAAAAPLTDFVPRYLNQAIQFTGEDMGSDRSMMQALLYILIVIIAFVFGVTIRNTIHQEAGVIGTLRASGYKKGELIRHYMTLPLCVTLLAALIGNVLGYTVLKDVCAGLYYASYSLPTYETIWNVNAFVETTVIPFLLMLVVNYLVLRRSLSLSPIQFLRRDLKRKQKKKAVRLPDFSFFSRFRLRIIFQNMGNYGILLIGLLFANLLLLFGLALPAVLDNFQEEVTHNMIADYQYILKAPVETAQETAETYATRSLETVGGKYAEDTIQVYGVQTDSAYVPLDFTEEGVYVSNGYWDKFHLSKGDTITVKEKYEDTRYEYTVLGSYDYPAAMAIFMKLEDYRDSFDYGEDYYNGYFTNTELTDIDEAYIYGTVTEEDLTKLSRQLDVSMGSMMYLVQGFAVVLFLALMYLLSKIVIEKNSTSISMTKILGYTNGEIGRLYIVSTSIAVAVCIAISIPVGYYVLGVIFREMILQKMSGWIVYQVPPVIFVEMAVAGMLSYGVVAVLLYRKIQKVPMSEALKNVE